MLTDTDNFDLEPADGEAPRGGLVGFAVMALALGAGTALLFAPTAGAHRRRRPRRPSALLGLAVGAGVAALLLPQSGAETRRKLSEAFRRRTSGVDEVVDRVVRQPEPEHLPAS